MKLEVSIELQGAGVCDLLVNHTQAVRDGLASTLTVKSGHSFGSDDIVSFDTDGCDAYLLNGSLHSMRMMVWKFW